ncbi:MAG: universal stress protein [Xanthomonadales bacterium]|nr:universal stress protein [Gammaproteobacteria bacterium]NND57930.1 universal stress protein [Xanthomonadales bacterium]NNK50904.1 universal stress protein [Xanthomonadales bacterium]
MSSDRIFSEIGSPVLVAIDFSEDSKAALIWACHFAQCSGAPITLLHVVHDMASQPGFYHPKKTDRLEPMQDVAEAMMVEFLEQVRTEHPELSALDTLDLQFVPGLPPSRIVEVAGLLKAQLIVMGSRGITSLPHKLLGAVAERVAELSTIPVVVVKSETHGEMGKKEKKRVKKQIKKDRKKLKEILGIKSKEDQPDDVNE